MVLAVADAREIPLADESVQCCITSPPYWGLRDYGLNGRGIGLEASPDEYVAQIVGVFREVRRVLRKDGTVWLNLGDSYNAQPGQRTEHDKAGYKQSSNRGSCETASRSAKGLKPKDLVGIPWRVALALQKDGWWLRSDIIWHKPNPMPESVTDRPTRAHEYVFLLAKARSYYYDAEALREAVSGTAHARHAEGKEPSLAFKMEEPGKGNRNNPSFQSYMRDLPPENGRNKRSVWAALENEFAQFLRWKAAQEIRPDVWGITTQPYKGAHFATFPVKLVEPMVLAGTSAKGCCPECRKPWERVVDKSTRFEGGSGKAGRTPSEIGGKWGDARHGKNILLGPVVDTATVGWRPGCDCYNLDYWRDFPQARSARKRHQRDVTGDWWRRVRKRPGRGSWPTEPCIALDCFGGTMTVGQVCAKHGRRFVGLDLKREYVEMGRERCASVQTAYAL